MSDDIEEDEIALVGVKAPAAAASVVRPSATTTIDLCNDDDDDDENNVRNVGPLTKKRRQRRMLGTSTSTTATTTSDFIRSVDRNGHVDDEKEDIHETRYRQALGPVRMEFLSGDDWFTAHALAKERSIHRTSTTSSRTAATATTLVHELLEYQLNLPVHWSSSIFCRVWEARTDLLRVLITGPEGTPYANGCFFFDLFLSNYPQQAPKVTFLTTGQGQVRFNPNLYQCGKVCLSLLGTWEGPGWVAGKSTILQVLVSIQGLILVPDPYFNEPGFERSRNTARGQTASDAYNATIRRYTLQHAILDPIQRIAQSFTMNITDGGAQRHPHVYPEFAQVMLRHFAVKAAALEEQLEEWTRQDRSLDSLARPIRQHLAVIVQHYEQQQQQQQQRKLAASRTGSASNKTPETIVLLDE